MIIDVLPNTACYESPETIKIEIVGESFVKYEDGSLPIVYMGGQPYHPTEVGGCTQFGTTASDQ